jgi:hypothetical protein
VKSPWAWLGDDRINPDPSLPDPIPPGHGEHESELPFGGGSNTYTDEEWDCMYREEIAWAGRFA